MSRIRAGALLLVVCVWHTACDRRQSSATVPTPSPTQINEPIATLTPTTKLAPEGTFYLKERVSITTESGVTGVVPGTEVRFVRSADDNVYVTNGEIEFLVSKSQLTNDSDEAAAIVASDQRAQAEVKRAIGQRKSEYKRRKADEQAGLAQRQLQKDKTQLKSPVPTPYNNPLEKRAYNATNAKKYTDAYGRVYWIDIWGHRHYE